LSRSVPVIVTVVPFGPLVGSKLAIAGAGPEVEPTVVVGGGTSPTGGLMGRNGSGTIDFRRPHRATPQWTRFSQAFTRTPRTVPTTCASCGPSTRLGHATPLGVGAN